MELLSLLYYGTLMSLNKLLLCMAYRIHNWRV